jgi:hypothetical protein
MLQNAHFRDLELAIRELIDNAKLLGARDEDIRNALEFLPVDEFGVAWELIVDQIYEYQIPIDRDFYDLAETIAKKMKFPEERYSFLRELIMKEPMNRG